jgi:hypothetical protein
LLLSARPALAALPCATAAGEPGPDTRTVRCGKVDCPRLGKRLLGRILTSNDRSQVEWIRRNRILLGIVLTVSAIVSVVELFWTRSVEQLVVQPWQLGLLMLPWFTTAGALLSLCYLLWFGRRWQPGWLSVAKLFFWAIVAAFVMLFVVIYGSFVFRLF